MNRAKNTVVEKHHEDERLKHKNTAQIKFGAIHPDVASFVPISEELREDSASSQLPQKYLESP